MGTRGQSFQPNVVYQSHAFLSGPGGARCRVIKGKRTSWYCICGITCLNTKSYIQRRTAVRAPDGGGKQQHCRGNLHQKNSTYIHTDLHPMHIIYLHSSTLLRVTNESPMFHARLSQQHEQAACWEWLEISSPYNEKEKKQRRVQRNFSDTCTCKYGQIFEFREPTQLPGWVFSPGRRMECWALP